MLPKDLIIRAISLLLLSLGLFQIIASVIAIVFLLMVGHWTDLVPQIVAIAFWLTLPTTYLIWRKWFGGS